MPKKEPKKKLKIYVAEHCTPCHNIQKLLQDGAFLVNNEEGREVDLIDVETEEGFEDMVTRGVEAIPSAYEGDRRCQIKIDEEEKILILECPGG